MKYSGIGGQAVIEGVMMRNKEKVATAVRKPDQTIEVMEDTFESMTSKVKFLSLPFIRGIFAFIDSLTLGMKSLAFSSSFFEDDESEPSAFEKKLIALFGDKLEKVILTLTLIFSISASIVIFMLLPMFLGNILRYVINNYYIIAFLEGCIRIGIFILYIKLIARMPDIRRTFMYHGAEHKCINCIETGHPLTVENVMKSSKEHKRCGTSFLIIVMMISILFFMVIRVDTLWLRAISRILLIPIIAGVSYEFLRLAGLKESKFINFFSKPGLWMQGLTVSEPTPDMVEVAIVATERVFDWQAYLKENFHEV